ncbi:MAG: RNA 2',3'-cyclic phosphodiesterase [Deltaproteobacteria bacterium]|nr:RNA 2',3'-cyclic phosphodiesterase [Deltaproteobacteria bacterium]
MIRAFVALNLPVATLNRLAEAQKVLRRAAKQANVRVGWVPAANMHITLKFLGEIDAENIYAIRHRLGDRLIAWPAIDLRVEGLGVFPDVQRPRVLWAGLAAKGAQGVCELAEAVEEVLDELGFAREARPFHPHLTLGRIKEGDHPFWTDKRITDAGDGQGGEVVLYRSVLSGQGAEYKALARFPLQPPEKASLNAHGEGAGDDEGREPTVATVAIAEDAQKSPRVQEHSQEHEPKA